MKKAAVWIVIHIARGKAAADIIERALTDDGIMVRIKPAYKNRPDQDNDYQVCVLRSEVDEARAVLRNNQF